MVQPDARRRVCFVLPSLNGGGAERAAVQILNGLDSARWDRSMFLFQREGPYLSELAPGIRLVSADAATRLGRWRALRSFVAAERPELVMAFLSYFSILSAVRAANTGARVVFNQQTPMTAFLTDADYPWRHWWRKRLFTVATRLGYGAADRVIATSRGVSSDLTKNFGVSPDSIRVLPNPVDLDRVRAAMIEPVEAGLIPEGEGPLIVAAGRLADAKNYPLLIEAMAVLRQRVPARLLILGQGELEGEIRALIAARGLTGAVRLTGFHTNPWKIIARADVFVLTSRYEGFGNVLIEAMACGVPVVATVSPGTRDIVIDGADGVLVEHHTPAAVAAALERVLTDPAGRRQMAIAASVSADRFGLPVAVRTYDAVLTELLA